MFAVIITIIVAIVVLSNITVEVNNNVISSNKEIVMTSNVKSVEEYAAIYSRWVSIDTSVEEYSAEAVDVIITTTGTWKMTYVINKSVKFTGRTSYTGKTSGWLFENVNTGASDMYLQISGKSSAWEARNWFGNGNFAVNTKVVVK